MADEIKLKAPTVEQQVVVNINGEEKLRSFADTLDKISNNKNLQKYWKTQQELINATANAYGNFQKKASKDNATELIKVTNALKAMSGTDLSNILPDFDKISKAIAEAQKVAGNIDSAFSVKGFKEAFDSFEILKAYSEDIEKIFSHFGVSSDVGELQKNVRALEGEVEKLTRRLTNAKNANEELRNEFDNFKSGSGFADKLDELDNLKSEMSYLREQAEETFRQFLKLNNITEDGYDRDGFYDDNRFKEYFQNIQSGYLSASDAIQQFKREYSYLLDDSFKSNNDTFGLEQLQAFSNKLDSIFRQVEETSTKINDIISNGVITKSVENLSMDSSLSDSQRSLFGNLLQDEESLKSITTLFQKLIEESNKTSKVDLFNDEQLQQVLSIFDKMEKHLSSLRSIISDVGDGEEFSPLLKMINNVQSSISELATSVKGIGLNMNIDVGSDSEMEAKVQSKIANALQAYQRLFDHIKMSSAGGSVINTNFFEFDINQYDTMMGKLQAYKKFIDNMRKEAKTQFNGKDVLYQDTEKSYWTQASAAMGQVTKAFNEMKSASDTNPLKDLFGSGDLSEIVSQLGLIVKKLEEISNTASSFKNIFKEGFNVTASVEEIDKLTNRVKELEDELSKIKLNHVNVDKSNISSENQNKQLLEGEEIRKNLYKINDEIGLSEEEFIQKLRQENEEVKNGNRQFQERLALLKDGKVVASYFGDKASMNIHNSDLVDSFDKVIHSHSPIEGSSVPSFEDLDLIFGKYKSEVKDFVLFYNNEMRSLQAPGDMSLLGSEFRDYGKFLDAISSLTSNSSIYSNYANNYLASIAEEAGVAYKQIDALGNEINSQRINTSDWEIILETMRQLTNMHRSQNQDAEFSQIAERGKELSNTFIDSKNAAEQFEISVESLYDILIKLWKSVENDGGKTAFKQLREQLTSLSSDNIKDILYGDEMFYDADGDANELKQVAQKIYDNYYLPLINGAKELKSETNSPMKDVFQGDDKVNTDASTTAIKEESHALEKVSASAKDAATSKEKFANANKEVKASADETVISVDKEISALEKAGSKFESQAAGLAIKPDDQHQFSSWKKQLEDLNIEIAEYKIKVENLSKIDIADEAQINKEKTEIEELGKSIKGTINVMTKTPQSKRGWTDIGASKAAEKVANVLKQNTKMSKEAKDAIRAYYNELRSGNPSQPIDEILVKVNQLVQKERELGRVGKSFGEIFKEKVIYGGAAQLAGMVGLYDVINVIKQAASTVTELNRQITELAKVSEQSSKQIYADFDSYADIAKEVRGTISDTIAATADWSKNGYSIPDAKQLAEISQLYKNVGDGIDIDAANESLISTLKGFQLEADQAEHIVDVFNEVDLLASYYSNVIALCVLMHIDSNYIG